MNKLLKIIFLSFKYGPKYFFLFWRREFKSRLKYYKTHEVRKSYGNEMPDKTFYITSINEVWCGLFAIIVHQLEHILYAVERGYIPIIDLQNCYNQYLGEKEFFKENSWEYFFEQPMGYGLRDIKKAKNVIIGINSGHPNKWNKTIPFLSYRECHNADTIAYYKEKFAKYIIFNSKTMSFLTEKHNEMFKDKGRILGIHCRGTDFTALKPSGHAIQPKPDEVIEKAEQVMNEYRCDHLYLATEDADIYDLFEAHFGSRLILDKATRRWRVCDLKGKSNSKVLASDDSAGKYKGGIDYLSQIYLLSKCNCFVSGATLGSLGVMLMTDKFEYQYIWNLGYYKQH
jgi:hypothetical protein